MRFQSTQVRNVAGRRSRCTFFMRLEIEHPHLPNEMRDQLVRLDICIVLAFATGVARRTALYQARRR